jgi:hypothetical protein
MVPDGTAPVYCCSPARASTAGRERTHLASARTSTMRTPSRLVLLLVLCAVVPGCPDGGHDHGDHAHADANATGAVCPPGGTSLTYAGFGRPFMTAYCTGCHESARTGNARDGAPSDHNYETLEGVRTWASDIDAHAAGGPNVVNVLMPPDVPRPSTAERLQLGEWLACGAPE